MKKMRKLLAGLMASLTLLSAFPASAASSSFTLQSNANLTSLVGITSVMYVKTSTPNNRLIMRSGASTSSSVVTKLSYGTKVTVHYMNLTGWALVTANGKTGYVASRYLSITNPSGGGTSASATTMYVKTSRPGSNLNMRAAASTSSSVVARLSYGTKVTVHSTSNGWAKVTANGKTGYVSTQYLSATDPAGGSTAASTTYDMYVKTSRPGSNLIMRSGASTSSSVVTRLAYGTKVTVHSTSNGWAKVTANGKTGYVSTQYLSKTNPAASSSGSTSVTPATGDMGPLLPSGAYFRGERDDRGMDGKSWKGNHDINGVSNGTPIYCPANATVYYRQATTWFGSQYKLTSYGNYVDIRCDNGYRIILAHLSRFEGVSGSITATEKQSGSNRTFDCGSRRLNAGEVIGYVGTTGNSDGPHVHIEVYNASGTRVDPATLFPSLVR